MKMKRPHSLARIVNISPTCHKLFHGDQFIQYVRSKPHRLLPRIRSQELSAPNKNHKGDKLGWTIGKGAL